CVRHPKSVQPILRRSDSSVRRSEGPFLLALVLSLTPFFLTVYIKGLTLKRKIPDGGNHPRAPFCYNVPQEKYDPEIPTLPGHKVTPNSIFFLDTSCSHGYGVNLSLRQACAYESAARAHPQSQVLVLFSSPISLDEPSPVVTVLLTYENLKFVRILEGNFFNRTPLETFRFYEKIAGSSFPESHASDILRLSILWKYGGTYLDSDIIVCRRLNGMKNFAGAESDKLINGAVLNFDTTRKSKSIIEEMLKKIQENFQPTSWTKNGPEVLTDVLSRLCNETDLTKISRARCGGFSVFPPPPRSPFYPIAYWDWRALFKEHSDPSFVKYLATRSTVHFWNRMSKSSPVDVHSNMPFNLLAAEFCPRVHSIATDHF
ncbi:lactosylceramide 4-alpha-galactosyltransferase, partial [Bemisia tabaci]|uniref:lactosylceramide 4-alpha-galactosyltransferase n=1 Tax=Bemisia tabaci TaxID=7038 RepID=UPI003B28547A